MEDVLTVKIVAAQCREFGQKMKASSTELCSRGVGKTCDRSIEERR